MTYEFTCLSECTWWDFSTIAIPAEIIIFLESLTIVSRTYAGSSQKEM